MSVICAPLHADELAVGVEVLDNQGTQWGRIVSLEWIALQYAQRAPLVVHCQIQWAEDVYAEVDWPAGDGVVIARWELPEVSES